MSLSPWLRKLFTGVLVAAAFGFLGWEIFRNLGALRAFDWRMRPLLLLASVGLLSLVMLWGVWVWQRLLRSFGAAVPYPALARTWFLANLSRYIPGVVWQFISLAQLGAAAGLTPVLAISSVLVQMGLQLIAAGVLGVLLLPVELAGEFAPVLHALRWASPLALLLVHPAVIRLAIGVVVRVARRPVAPWEGGWGEGILLLALSAVTWLVYGGAFYLFLLAFVDLAARALLAAIAINALAFIAGYLVFFAPGGWGVKELTLAALLGGVVPAPVAASLAIAARLWSIAGEALPIPFFLRRRSVAPRPVLPPPEE